MNNQEFDSLLRRVVVDSIRDYTEQFSNKDLLFLPSVGYSRQVRMMLSNPLGWAKRRMLPVWKKTLRTVAMIVVAIFVAMGCLIAFSSPVRAAVKQWMLEIYDKYISYRYVGVIEDFELQDYEITELPDGYVEVERNQFPRMVDVIYRNSDGKYILFQYVYMETGSVTSYVTDGGQDSIDITVNNFEGTYWESFAVDEFSTLMWIDSYSNIQFTLDAQLSYLGILHMAESVSLCKYTK